jgi:pimeloyl-ACP methyl ester carboxylesterase
VTTPTVVLRHNRVDLALHHLRDAVEDEVHALLVLHGLGERTPAAAPAWTDGWPGPVWGLDLTGHGASSLSRGGGYTAEVLMADAAIAALHLGTVTLVGRGLGPTSPSSPPGPAPRASTARCCSTVPGWPAVARPRVRP